MTGEKNKYNNFAPKNIEEAIKAVEKFNQENKYRDGGYINSSINMVLKENEELKEKNEILREELKSKIEALDIAMSNPDYICKDKIKWKIKVLNKDLKKCGSTDIITRHIIANNIEFLVELLEEE